MSFVTDQIMFRQNIIIIKSVNQQMGCGSSSQQNSFLAPVKVPTKSGFLKIVVESAHINRQTSTVFKMDPYVKIKMAHQNYETKPQLKAGTDPNFNQSFQFAVNSCYKKFGRNLEVQIWDKNKISDSEIGYGIIDLDPTIRLNKINQKIRCFINYQRKQAGYVNLVAEFKQSPSQTLKFRFETSFLRRKLRTIGEMNVKVRVTLGEQILQTKLCKDDKDLPPKWGNQVLEFQVPTLLKQGKIQVLDQNKLIGDLQFDVKELLQGKNQKQFNQDIFFQQKPGKDVVAGELKYSTLYGIQGKFSQIKEVKKTASKIGGTDTQINIAKQGNQKNQPTVQQIKKMQSKDIKKNVQQESSVKIQVKANNKNEERININGNGNAQTSHLLKNTDAPQLTVQKVVSNNKVSPLDGQLKEDLKEAKKAVQIVKKQQNNHRGNTNTTNLKEQVKNTTQFSKFDQNTAKAQFPSAITNKSGVKDQSEQKKNKVQSKEQQKQGKQEPVEPKRQKMRHQQQNEKPLQNYYTIGTQLDVGNKEQSAELKNNQLNKEQPIQ